MSPIAIAREWERLTPNMRRRLFSLYPEAFEQARLLHFDYQVESIRAEWEREREREAMRRSFHEAMAERIHDRIARSAI